MQQRDLGRADLALLDQIDRRELIEQLYLLDGGKLTLYEERFDMDGWPPGEAQQNAEVLAACFARGGWFHGVFDGEMLVALVVLDSVLLQVERPALQLKFLHVSRDYRGRGIAGRLFRLACARAPSMGAQEIHISATPSRNTVDFYLHLGCTLLDSPDPELLRIEPEDIHLCHRLG
ncbi:GNAT family N-acetyltransferase [Collimonas pratensis]|uniref:Acetyltransferase family protein n=1 Tax=Collimonas pratensis TaxID=279113 RepID=A0A127Q2B6_9BURK|nr:GNAT family N-acetyltransferase [Collimonas pratensis]AMP04171.1 acetyltransferase family protein [Collimonas pratensis]